MEAVAVKKWYVVHTYSGQELAVQKYIEMLVEREQLQSQIGTVLVPTQEVVTISGGKKRSHTKKFFPSYILIEMEMNDDTMHYVTNIPGVTHFVGSNGKAESILPEEVNRLLGVTEGEEKLGGDVIEIPFRVGEAVRIKAGPFKDFDGTVEEINPEKGKLKVMVSVFGRSTPVELGFTQVEGL
jgi:transcriptional antiterminator NusG